MFTKNGKIYNIRDRKQQRKFTTGIVTYRFTAVIWQNQATMKNYVFENIDFVDICYGLTRIKVNQIFCFALKLLTVRALIISSRLVISSFT